MSATSHVDVAFPLLGKELPLDHGYFLFAAVVDAIADLRDDHAWGLHSIAGQPLGNDRMALHRSSFLKIRTPAERLPKLLPLAGRVLRIGRDQVRVAVPRVFALTPSPQLRARYATIKNAMEPDAFLEALRIKLAAVEDLGQDPERIEIEVGSRRVTRMRGDTIVGFAVSLLNLEDRASIRIQEQGLGGRRHIGAGIFVPPRKRDRR